MSAQMIDRSKLGALDKVGQGGQGVVYRAPNVTTKFASSMVYKEYKPAVLTGVDFTALRAMPALVEDTLTYRDAQRLIDVASWPCALVENGGSPMGFVMPAIPDEFFTSLTTAKGATTVTAEFQHLLNHEQVLAARGITLDDAQRYTLVRETASALAFLHKHGVCVGDLSPKNLLFSVSPRSAVYFIDCDAMRINGVSVLPQVETPGWQTPAGEELATIHSDSYKLGLLALRLLAGDQDTTNPQRLPAHTPGLLRQIITDTLRNEPERRPLPEAWTYVLGHAIEEAQHHKQTAAAPVGVPLDPPRTPVLHSRPTAGATQSRPSVPAAYYGAPVNSPPAVSAAPLKTTNVSPVAIVVGSVAIAIVVAVVLVAALHKTNSGSNTTAQTITQTYPAYSAPPSSAAAVAPPIDPGVAADQQLQALRSQDAPALDQVVDRWIPQLSSKHGTQPWTYDQEEGKSYDSELTLQEHQQLRQRYGAKLVWSGDWTTWDHPDYWVTVVPIAFPTAAGVLGWCNGNGFDKDHCSAQVVSKTLGTNGTHG